MVDPKEWISIWKKEKKKKDLKPFKKNKEKPHTSKETNKTKQKIHLEDTTLTKQRLISFFTSLISTNAVEVLWTEALQSSGVLLLNHWYLVLVKFGGPL